ncbi:MAG: SMI1/KNR4 family protein [Candidatus Sericytochromatia bacterium]
MFGSSKHKYIINPCLSKDEINLFENKYKVRLPNEYKYFLMKVGNGVVGPYYGLNSLEDSLGYHKHNNTLFKDFPYKDEINQKNNRDLCYELFLDDNENEPYNLYNEIHRGALHNLFLWLWSFIFA